MYFYCEWTGDIVVTPSHMDSSICNGGPYDTVLCTFIVNGQVALWSPHPTWTLPYVMVVLMTLGVAALCTFIVNGQVTLWSPQPTRTLQNVMVVIMVPDSTVICRGVVKLS